MPLLSKIIPLAIDMHIVYRISLSEKFNEHERMISNKFNKPFIIIRSDEGGENISYDIKSI